jgi:dienelactone hydrolase
VADFLPPLTASPWPTALLLHSAASERGRLEGLAVRLAAEGVASLRVDLRGHGESLDRGRFEAGRVAETRHLLEEAPEDVAAALGALAAERGADRRPPAVVASSYSVEAAARAARSGAPVAAWVALSPGDFSAQSIAWAGAEAKSWWFLRSEREPDFFDELFARLERGVPQAEITVLSAGGHGDSLLAEYPGLDRRIARWVAEQLSNAGPAGTSAAFDR